MRDRNGPEGRVGRSAQEPVELVQLASLALPSHPFVLARIEDAVSMQEKEAVASWGGAVAAVQLLDRPGGRREQMRIAFQNLLIGVDPVGKEGEAKIPSGAGEVMDLQSFDLL